MESFVPQELLQLDFVCIACKSPIEIDWLKDTGDNTGSIIPNGNPKGFWRRLTFDIICQNCGTKNSFPIPNVELTAKYHLFGDEAYRDLSKNEKLYSYSIIGAANGFHKEIEDKIKDLKKSLLPHLPVESWKIHMKTLWAGDSRKKHPIFNQISKEKIDKFISDLAVLFRDLDDKIFKANVLSLGLFGKLSKQVENRFKAETYITLIGSLINHLTEQGLQPSFVFDAEKVVKADKVIQQWAKNSFSNGCNKILYAFISHGIPIEEPIFVTPASHPILELADVMCFIITRYAAKKYLNQETDISCDLLGKVNYHAFTDYSSFFEFINSTTFPWTFEPYTIKPL